ncbi:cation-translocating P-type ATPase [Actinomyces urinae]|uniref:cation-translocating P-type ATPase n=1 Tax=Actinomyces urinae TaxID=1689268 RepID=UPI000931629B|nr:cation-translocating P-type ATPase [Actinomyces urinae]
MSETAATKDRYLGHVGVSAHDVARAKQLGKTNWVESTTSRPIKVIIRSNLFTLFNAILTTAVVVVLLVGNWRDAVFGIVMVTNAVIGIYSEIRAKYVLDSLAILESPRSWVIRDGARVQVSSAELILGDLVLLGSGDQVPTDGTVLESYGLRVDESMLTGESVPVRKREGDSVLSGTAVVAGEALFETSKVGEDSYANRLTKEAKQFKRVKSEIGQSINTILKWISWVILPVVLLLVASQLRSDEGTTWQHAVVLAVAGVVGMIPQGLVLLTSLNFALAGAGLAKRNVLIQELGAVEVLARVDRLCLDKTGTITTGEIAPQQVICLDESIEEDAQSALAAMVAGGENQTAKATMAGLSGIEPAKLEQVVPFDSSRKWSAAVTDSGSWYFGAPDIVANHAVNAAQTLDQVSTFTEQGARVVCLAHSTSDHIDEDKPSLPKQLRAVLIVVLAEQIRADAADTISYFLRQDVQIKVISGDSPSTVAAIANRVGVRRGEPVKVLDARDLPQAEEDFVEAVNEFDVFGRVTPETKRKMVKALQSRGHTVAMTGDGVNDVLALKDADLGIAMGSGAPATRAVAKLVLVDGKFSKLPRVVAEGRRIIANMERVSSLFLTKTAMSALLAVLVAIFAWRYPFLPRHLTIISSLTIGIPAFFLSLTPNYRRYRPGFLERTLHIAIPSGIVLAVTALVAQRFYAAQSLEVGSTVATLAVLMAALYLLSVMSRPIVAYRAVILFAMLSAGVAIVLIEPMRAFFALTWPTPTQWLGVLVLAAACSFLIELVFRNYSRKFGDLNRIVGDIDE